MFFRRQLNDVDVGRDEVVKTARIQEVTRPHKLLVEAWAMREALLQGMRVPKVLDYYRNNLGKEVLVQERISGRSLENLRTEAATRAYREIGQQLAGRKCVYEKFGWIEPSSMTGVFSSWPEFLVAFASSYGEKLIRRKVVKHEDLGCIVSWLKSEGSIRLARSAIVHRDLTAGNIILSPNGAYLIDWENAILGDPVFDLAVFRANYGADDRWQALVAPCLPLEARTLHFYTAIALLGVIEFHQARGESTTVLVGRFHHELSMQRI